jgi:hypothetical protein
MAPGAQPKPTPKETNNDTQTTSKDEPVVDKTMINILRVISSHFFDQSNVFFH